MISKRFKAMKTCNIAFSFSNEDLCMESDLPNRLFELLEAFVASLQAKNSNNSTPEQRFSHEVILKQPSAEVRAYLIKAIHTIENELIAFASDTVGRVINDIKA